MTRLIISGNIFYILIFRLTRKYENPSTPDSMVTAVCGGD